MGRIIYVTGGRRSGKSAFAQALAEKMGETKAYIAACPVMDAEIQARVEAHRKAREGKGWKTIEEEIELTRVISEQSGAEVILVECLTLWVNNLMYQAELSGKALAGAEAETLMKEALAAAGRAEGAVIFVSNEVGWGIIPDNPLARSYSDISGRINQLTAEKADEAYLVVSGLVIKIK